MKINWNLDLETIEDAVDPDDLLGNIEILDDNSKIFDSNIYLDNWFDSLIDGLISLKNGNDLESDLITEPDPLVFKNQKDGFSISYKSQLIFINNIDDFEISLVKSCKDLISMVEKKAPNKTKESLVKIETFVNTANDMK